MNSFKKLSKESVFNGAQVLSSASQAHSIHSVLLVVLTSSLAKMNPNSTRKATKLNILFLLSALRAVITAADIMQSTSLDAV